MNAIINLFVAHKLLLLEEYHNNNNRKAFCYQLGWNLSFQNKFQTELRCPGAGDIGIIITDTNAIPTTLDNTPLIIMTIVEWKMDTWPVMLH